MRRSVLSFTVFTAFLHGADVYWSHPVLGYVFDPADRSIRIVAGVPGAAGLDSSIPSAAKLRNAWIAPRRQFAVVELADSGDLGLLDWSTGAARIREIAGALRSAESVSFSARGDAAILASGQHGIVQVWTGLPAAPVVRWETAARMDVVVVSDDGELAAGVDSSGAHLLAPGATRLVARGSFTAAAFRPGTRDLALASRDSDTIQLVRDAAAAEPLAGAAEGVFGPVAVQFSASGARLAIANAHGRSFTIFDFETRSARTIACDCTPESLEPLRGDAVFRSAGNVFIDAGAAEPRTFIVAGAGN
jgi:hypothetical protein